MTRIETFLPSSIGSRVTRDECNDQVIQGGRGLLHFDGPDLCLMVPDGAPPSNPDGRRFEIPGRQFDKLSIIFSRPDTSKFHASVIPASTAVSAGPSPPAQEQPQLPVNLLHQRPPRRPASYPNRPRL